MPGGRFYTKVMDYSEKFVAELMRGLDPYSILVMVGQKELKRLQCPFKAEVIIPVGGLSEGENVSVEAVKVTLELKDVFIIEGKAYYIIHFKIVI